MESTARPGFFDSRAAYTMFGATTTEKTEVAGRMDRVATHARPVPDAAHLFDARSGGATVLAEVARAGR